MPTIYTFFQLQLLQEFHTNGSGHLNLPFDKMIPFFRKVEEFSLESESLLENEVGWRKREIAGGGAFVFAMQHQHQGCQPVPPNNPN